MSSSSSSTASDSTLSLACQVLGMVDGCLLPATAFPTPENAEAWIDKGDWLRLAHELQADSIFFIKNEPVLVMASLPEGVEEAAFFNRIWCMARPQILFLAKDGELAVYKLAAPPVRGQEKVRHANRLLELAETSASIQEKLADFSRERIESGQLLAEARFGTGYDRADRALVNDLKAVLRILTSGEEPLSHEVAHSLIGRALFVRYLEDREILVPSYFQAVAGNSGSWAKILAKPVSVFPESRHAELQFFRVLNNKDFTYAFFKQLSLDFNGDTFPVTEQEAREVKAHHLATLRKLLTGEADEGLQQQLFLFAYQFDVIPIELISSIYEEFYTAKRGKGNTQSSYYTPPALADFVLARVLTKAVLDQRPRLIDPACGSGIFLVEAFRRMVRHRTAKQGKKLSQRELRVILREQIRGIDLNPEAVPVAAFSLYLAYLHYQDPKEIDESRKLPNLRWKADWTDHQLDQHLDILFQGNAFEVVASDDPVLKKNFGPASADVVVGNPPWGEVKPSDDIGRAAMPITKKWLTKHNHVIGDNELSQAFIHLALELLADGGMAGLLLSSGVLFKQHDNSRAFRQSWLTRCKLDQIVNFAHVRHIFFSDPTRPRKGQKGASVREADGSSPFISAVFEKGSPRSDHRFDLWSARRTMEIENTRAVVISPSDMHRVRQEDCRRKESLWKLYWWGNRRDEGLVREMERFPTLGNLNQQRSSIFITPGRGFQVSNSKLPAEWLVEFKELPISEFHRYGNAHTKDLIPPPSKVERRGVREVFEGRRLLIKRGVGHHGIIARIETEPLAFRNSIIGMKLAGLSKCEEALILASFWSSLGQYYFWLTAGSWGMWHDEIHVHGALSLPVYLVPSGIAQQRIVALVENLQAGPSGEDVAKLESELDEAVFDLYELTEADRDLVRDMCRYGLDFFYKKGKSIAVAPVSLPSTNFGKQSDLPVERAEGITGYLQVFLSLWNADLEPEGELGWEVIEGPRGAGVVAVVFFTINKGDSIKSVRKESPQGWDAVMKRLAKNSLVPKATRQAIFTDTFVRAVSEHEIIIVKRNEARHWTRSMARDDADATINRAMKLAENEG